MPKLPYIEFHAPQIDPLVGAPGIVEILWGDRRDDGTFAEVRIILRTRSCIVSSLDDEHLC